MMEFHDLTDEEWQRIAPLLRNDAPGREKPGPRPKTDPRAAPNGVLWVLTTYSKWAAMPDRYPPWETCYGYYRIWVRSGALHSAAVALASTLGDDLREILRLRRYRPRVATDIDNSNDAAVGR